MKTPKRYAGKLVTKVSVVGSDGTLHPVLKPEELTVAREQSELEALLDAFENALLNGECGGSHRKVIYTRRKLLAYIAKLQKAARG